MTQTQEMNGLVREFRSDWPDMLGIWRAGSRALPTYTIWQKQE